MWMIKDASKCYKYFIYKLQLFMKLIVFISKYFATTNDTVFRNEQ